MDNVDLLALGGVMDIWTDGCVDLYRDIQHCIVFPTHCYELSLVPSNWTLPTVKLIAGCFQ